jgi:hypothetical protein
MDLSPRVPPSPIWHRFLLAAGFVLIAWFYAWTNDPTAASWRVHGPQSDYYNVLIHGFLKGHLYMDFPVAKELLECPDPWNPAVRGPNIPILQDATYYNGHYYLYYGVAPLTLMLPFRLLTGADLPLSLATLVFACGGLLVGLILWESIRERYFPEVRAWVGLAVALMLGVANPMPVLLRRTLVYELPIASGCFFGLMTLLALYWSIHSQRFRLRWMVVASVCLGLAVASRMTFLFAMPILLIPAWIAWREQEQRKFSTLPVRVLLAAIAPIAAIGAIMAVYNFQRYGQFTQFGTKYQVAEMFNLMNPRRFAADFIPFNTVDYLLATPDLSRHFPYFYFPGAWHWSTRAPADYWGPELVPGMLTCFPICALAVLSILTGTSSADQRRWLGGWLPCAWGLFAATFVCLLCYYAGAVRYMVDFTPSLMLCASVGLLVVERGLLRTRSTAIRTIGRATWIGFLTASVLVGVMFSLGVRATFRGVDPVGHARVARFFESLSFWNPRLPNKGGPVEVTLRLDKLGLRETEPLFACGAGRSSEHVFLRRTADEQVVVGYRRGLEGEAQLGAPITVRPGQVHRIYLDLGSLYSRSPDEVAAAGNTASQQREKFIHRWLILFDDDLVLQGQYRDDENKPAGKLVFLGCNPNSDDFGKKLTSPILSVRRLSLIEAATRAANRSSLSLEFKAPRTKSQGAETLMDVAGAGTDLHGQIEFLGEGRAGLKFWLGGREVGHANPFPNNGQWHRLELDQVYDGGENTIHVRMDAAPVAAFPGGRIELRHDELRPGWGATSGTPFTGLIRNAGSDSVKPVKLPPRGRHTAMTVVFPKQRNGSSEPLLVTGQNGAGDLYEVVYVDSDHVTFQQDHWGAGIVRKSPAMKVNPDVPHRIVISFGQPVSGANPPRGVRNGTVSLTIDGQRVWDKDAPGHEFREDQMYFGMNEIGGSTCSREFSGEIISCESDLAAGPPLSE